MAGDYKELLEAIDEAIGNMIKQLELVHTNVFSTSSSGKASEDGTSDESLALRLQKRELDNLSLLLSDKRMARSIAEAVQSDGQVLTETLSQEHIVARDRELARQLTDGAEALDADDPDVHSEPEELDDELLAKMQVLYVSGLTETRHGLDHPEEGQAESSASGARRAIDPASITRQCEACREEKKFFDLARTPCRHEYCRPCLEKLFETAMTDESLFPPHCCSQPIPMTTVRIFLKSELVHLFEKKKVEFATPNRTYCCSPICSEFINVEHIRGDVATCPECGTTTCTMCKAATHGGDCPNDKALQQVLATASENHWQRCYSCRTVVELDHGCNHMTLVHIFTFGLIHTDTAQGVVAVPSSVMFADRNGRLVPASNGMSSVCSLMRIIISTASLTP